MNASQRGTRNRRAGHEWERNCAKWLSARLGTDVRTTRDVMRGAGPDLAVQDTSGNWRPYILGWAVECKYEQTWAPQRWLDQAIDQAAYYDALPLVMAARPGCRLEDGWAIARLSDVTGGAEGGWVGMPIGTFWREVA